MRKLRSIVVSILCISIVAIPEANADTTSFLCGGTAGYSVLMPEGILVNGTKCSGVLIIDESVKIISNSAFAGSKLTSVTIPNSVTSIGSNAFSGTPLTGVVVGKAVTSIGGYAFAGAKLLKEISLPEGLISLGENVFSSNFMLSKILYCGTLTGFPITPTCLSEAQTASDRSAADQIEVELTKALTGEQRTAWDVGQLPNLPADQTRALFGFNPLTSSQSDYSWSFEIEKVNTFHALVKPCGSTPIDYFSACIKDVSYRKIGSNVWQSAELSKTQLAEASINDFSSSLITSANLTVGKIPFDPKTLRPGGEKASLWSMPRAPHLAGSDYMARVALSGSINSSCYCLTFNSELLPINYSAGTNNLTLEEIRIEEFPKGFEYKIRINMGVFNKMLTGWFFGRLISPVLERRDILGNNNFESILELTGAPAFVPVGITDPINKTSASQYFDQAYWCAKTQAKVTEPCGNFNQLNRKAFVFTSKADLGPESLSGWESAPGGVKTAATLSYWSLGSATFEELSNYTADSNECVTKLYGAIQVGMKRVFQGAVFSNATLFQPSPPRWDPATQSFIFKVAAPHLDEKGAINKGSYTLYIPTDMAKCHWGSATSTGKAEVQIINTDGKTSVTTVAATTENGNLRFNIAGFGYSSPTIKIRMGNDVSGSVQTSANKATLKTITITCIKGKVTKKVTAVSPKCPTGYKKK